MTEISEGELVRRAKISKARREGGWSSNDASAARRVRSERATAWALTIKPVIERLILQGCETNVDIAEKLNRMQISAARGGLWSAKQVERVRAKFPIQSQD
jgi:hypothetical protein